MCMLCTFIMYFSRKKESIKWEISLIIIFITAQVEENNIPCCSNFYSSHLSLWKSKYLCVQKLILFSEPPHTSVAENKVCTLWVQTHCIHSLLLFGDYSKNSGTYLDTLVPCIFKYLLQIFLLGWGYGDMTSLQFTHSFSRILDTYVHNPIWEGHFYYVSNKMSGIHQVREAVALLCQPSTGCWAPWGPSGLAWVTALVSPKASRHHSRINSCSTGERLRKILSSKSGERYKYLHTVIGPHWSPT